jgi:phage shock protein E
LSHGYRQVPVADAAPRLDDEHAAVVDCRTPAEYAAGHLPRAVLADIQSPDFADKLADLDRGTPVLLYCRSGNRSRMAGRRMVELGFTDVLDVAGGIVAWQNQGQPIVP